MEQRSFYRSYGFADKLVEGAKLKLEHTVEYDHFYRDVPEMAPLIVLSISELMEKRRASVKLEWEKQAAQTLLLDKALEYVRTPTVEHTSNEWKQQKDGSWEISNLVYKMSYKIWEDTKGDKKETWLVSWELEMNCPTRPSTESMYYAGEATVAEQKRKRYDSFDAAQRYIQGRFDLYAPLFTVLSPPIPDKFKDIFRINGTLLPGYTIAPPEKMEPDKDAVDALLDCLGDEDIAPRRSPPRRPPSRRLPSRRPNRQRHPQKALSRIRPLLHSNVSRAVGIQRNPRTRRNRPRKDRKVCLWNLTLEKSLKSHAMLVSKKKTWTFRSWSISPWSN